MVSSLTPKESYETKLAVQIHSIAQTKCEMCILCHVPKRYIYIYIHIFIWRVYIYIYLAYIYMCVCCDIDIDNNNNHNNQKQMDISLYN